MSVLTVVGIIVMGGLGAYHGLPWVWKACLRGRLKRSAARGGRLVLTFDDGPGSRLTPAILDLLRDAGGKATFFLLGRNIAGREELVRRIAADGHEIGSHGYDHLDYWKIGPGRTLRDIRRGWQAIDRALGRHDGVYTFRPPYGKLNLAGLVYLWMHRVPLVYWTHDAGDTRAAGPRQTQGYWSAENMPDGAVVLIHDFDRTSSHIDDRITATVRGLLDRATERGMQVTTVSELLSSRRQVR